LFNAYWDMGTHSGFTPYIGAGIGFSWNQLRRVHNSTYLNCATCSDASGADKVHDITLAYALTAGVSYDMGRSTYLDFNYRYVWIEGTDVEMAIGTTNHTVSIGDLTEHQLRAGIRYVID
jgi:opacity protein-like surface antigen